MLGICWGYVGYMLDIARLGDGEVMVKLKRTIGSVSRTVPRLNPLCSAEFYGRINVLFVIKVFVYVCYDVYFCNVD